MSERKGRRVVIVDGKQIRYARYIMEQHLGRKLLRSELVHHINGDIKDDRIGNLQVMTHTEHQIIHHAGKKSPNWTGGRKASYRRFQKKHRKERAEYSRKYYQEHKKERQEYGREYGRKYYQKNREKRLEYQRKYRQKKRREKNG